MDDGYSSSIFFIAYAKQLDRFRYLLEMEKIITSNNS